MQRDTLVFDIIREELIRQRRGIELIAAENFTSLQVMQAMGGVMTNKYAEGYPGKRYYNGCEHVDVAENLAIERLKKLFIKIKEKSNLLFKMILVDFLNSICLILLMMYTLIWKSEPGLEYFV